MKKFIRTIQSLSERAAEFQEAIQSVPPRVAELREAVSMTGGQLQQLQADVQRNVMDLKADGQDRLVEALHEVNGSTEVFEEAGYELGQVEMELSPVPRLMVHLNRVSDMQDSMLRLLAAANRDRRITHALLTSVMQAEAMADQVDITGQVYYKLIVHIGPVPAIRLCWMPEAGPSVLATPSVAAKSPQTPALAASSLSAYGDDSFFGNRSTDQADTQPAALPAANPTHAPPAETTVASTRGAERTSYPTARKDWGASSLERFKKMPGVSKYRR